MVIYILCYINKFQFKEQKWDFEFKLLSNVFATIGGVADFRLAANSFRKKINNLIKQQNCYFRTCQYVLEWKKKYVL